MPYDGYGDGYWPQIGDNPSIWDEGRDDNSWGDWTDYANLIFDTLAGIPDPPGYGGGEDRQDDDKPRIIRLPGPRDPKLPDPIPPRVNEGGGVVDWIKDNKDWLKLGGLAGGTILSGLGGGGGGNRDLDDPSFEALIQQMTGLTRQQQQQGFKLFNMAMGGLKEPIDFFRALLGVGGTPAEQRAARQHALQPTLDALEYGQAGQEQKLRDVIPRGGVLDQALAQSKNEAYKQRMGLHAGLQPAAAQQLSQTMAQLLGMAGGYGENASSTAARIWSSLIGQANVAQGQQQLDQEKWGNMGKFIYEGAKNIDWGKILGG